MKVFAIHDKFKDKKEIGYIFYYERSDYYVVELDETLDEWTAPLLFSSLVKRGIYTIPRNVARLWIEERVIPSGRQNIGIILRNAKMTTYNEAKLLVLSKGESAQDDCYIREVTLDTIPDWVKERQYNNIFECFPIADNRIICLLNDDTVLEVDLRKCVEAVPKIETILSNERLLSTLKVDAGGYSVSINQDIILEKRILLEHGVVIPIYAQVFREFAKHSIINTTEACSMLECTRQNMRHLIKTDVLHPLKNGWRENVFLRGEITSID